MLQHSSTKSACVDAFAERVAFPYTTRSHSKPVTKFACHVRLVGKSYMRRYLHQRSPSPRQDCGASHPSEPDPEAWALSGEQRSRSLKRPQRGSCQHGSAARIPSRRERLHYLVEMNRHFATLGDPCLVDLLR